MLERDKQRIDGVNRNYDTILYSNGKYDMYYNDAKRTPYQLNQTITRNLSRRAVLTVNNPYRATRPIGWVPTARTLNHVLVLNPANNREITKSGYVSVTSGLPDLERNNQVWNDWFVLRPNQFKVHDEQLRSEAIFEAMQNLKDQKWNAGVMLAESEGVAKMAVDAMQLIARTRKSIRKGDFSTAYVHFRKQTKYMSYPEWRRKYWQQVRRDSRVRSARKIPESWLYYHFGIKPTLDDISSAAEAFALKKSSQAFEFGGIVHGYARHTFRETSDVSASSQYFGFNGTSFIEATRSVRVAMRVFPKAPMLAKLSGLGVTNPPEAIYNRLPFSWVVDYFTTFGDWLSALDVGLGWTIDGKWTESFRLDAKSKFVPRSGAGVKYIWPVQNPTLSHKQITRSVKIDPYGPMGTVLPHAKRKGPSLQQVANLLSVISSLFR